MRKYDYTSQTDPSGLLIFLKGIDSFIYTIAHIKTKVWLTRTRLSPRGVVYFFFAVWNGFRENGINK